MRLRYKSKGHGLEASEPFMYMNQSKGPSEPFMNPVPPYPAPFHPENVIHGPIRTRITEKQPSPEWLAALEAPRRETGKQEEPLWMAVRDQKAEYNRAVTAYRRDQLGRFLGGKGAWV